VALKLLIDEPWFGERGEDRSTAVARFLFEAQVAARLSAKTRHIVRVTDHGEERGLAYIVMELLEGQSLEKWMMLHDRMPLGTVSNLVAQIARGLEQAHGEGVVHRDLKPANIFLAEDEDAKRLVKLLDFGIARTIRSKRAFATAPGMLYGTPGYMSPEQLGSSSQIDHRCDLWALATIAYETLTGELPLPGCHAGELLRSLAAGRIVPIHERNPDLPRPLGAFFERAFAANIAERYPSAVELARAFKCASGLTGRSAPPSSGSSADRRGGTKLMRTLLMRARGREGSTRPSVQRLVFLVAVVVAGAMLTGLSTLNAVRRPPATWNAGTASAATAELVVASHESMPLAPERIGPTDGTPRDAPAVAPQGQTPPPAPVEVERPFRGAKPISGDGAPTPSRPPALLKPRIDKSRIL
jgi:serine/threonine-protein kinase